MKGVDEDPEMQLKRLRKREGLTQGQLAIRAGVSPRSVKNWESGTGNRPTLANSIRIAGALGVSLNELFGVAPPTGPSPALVEFARDLRDATARTSGVLRALAKRADQLAGEPDDETETG